MSNDDLSRHAAENEKEIKSLIRQLQSATGQQNEIIKKLKEANNKLREEIEKQDRSITQLNEKLFKHENVKKSTEIKQRHVDDEATWRVSEKDLHEARVQIRQLEEEKNELKNSFDKAFKELEKKLSDAEKQKKQEEDVNYKLKQHISNTENERDCLKRKMSELYTERDDLKSHLRRAEQNRDEYKNQVDDWVKKRHETVHVQMYAAVNKELCEKMMNELEGMLSFQFEINQKLIKVEKYRDPPPDSRAPLLVLCINASRLGTDVNQALQKVNRTRILAVVVLHHKEIHALPRQPSERLLIGSEYKDINLIVDIAYLTTKGIYTCDMNNKSLERLFSFIKSHS